jgi:hypothetical protein
LTTPAVCVKKDLNSVLKVKPLDGNNKQTRDLKKGAGKIAPQLLFFILKYQILGEFCAEEYSAFLLIR